MRLDPLRRVGSMLVVALVLVFMAAPATAATKSPTQMRLDPVAAVAWGERALVTAHVTLANGTPVGNVHVDLHINGDDSGGRTDAAGKATFNPHTPTLPGTYLITATFNGTSTLLASQASGRLTVKPRTLTIHTMPAQEGLSFVLDGKEFAADADGVAQIVVAPNFDDTVRPEAKALTVAPGVEERFARWRTHSGDIYATYDMYYEISLRFVDLAGNQIDPSRVAKVDFKSAIGTLVSVAPDQPFTVQGQRVVALTGAFQAKDITYAAQDVVVDGSSVVHVAQQRFTPSQLRIWTITLLFYSAHFSVRDALFGFPIDATVAVTYPDGREVTMPTDHGELNLLALARGDYHVAARGWGISFSRPVSLSRDQQVELKFISYLDVGVVVGLILLVALGLVALGRTGHSRALGTRLRREPMPVAVAADAAAGPVAASIPSGPLAGPVASGPRPVVDRANDPPSPLSPAPRGGLAMHGAAASWAGRTTRVSRFQATPATEPLAGRLKAILANQPPTTRPQAAPGIRAQAAPATEPLADRLEAARLQAARASAPVPTKPQATKAQATKAQATRVTRPEAAPVTRPQATRVTRPQAAPVTDAPPTPATAAPPTPPAKTVATSASEPAPTKPVATQSAKPAATGAAKPAAHAAAQPAATRAPKPAASEPAKAAASVAAKPVAANPVAAKPVAAKPEAAKPVAAEPVAAKPVAAKPVAAKPVAAKPVAAEPVAAKPVAAKPVAAKPVAAKPLEGEYIVRRGDTLRSIAAKALGNPDAWEEILRANPDVVFDPDRILPGTRLKIR